jgi:mono/diheme cytochrome c family protein
VREGVLAVFLTLLAGAWTVSGSPASPVDRGRALFQQHGCYGCHTIAGTGTPIAPDLSHAGAKYGEDQLVRLLRDPAVHRPGAHMPKIELTEAQRSALAAYLTSLQ